MTNLLITRKPLLLALAAVLLLVALLAPATTARANGVPQLVKLGQLEGISNWGPTEADGTLEFSFAEGYARLDVTGMAPLGDFTYEGWFLGTGGSIYVADLTTAEDGIGGFDVALPHMETFEYDTFVIAGRGNTEADVAGELPPNVSIGGTFSLVADPEDRSDDGGATAVQGHDEGTGQGAGRPSALPATGEKGIASIGDRLMTTFTTMLAVAVVSVAGFAIYRRRHAS